MAFLPLFAPRQLLYPLPVLVFALLVENPDYKAIAYWYQGLFLVTWFTAAVAGAERLARVVKGARAGAFAIGALAAAVGAAHFYGLLPFSRPTMLFQAPRSPEFLETSDALREFARAVPRDKTVLATMRAATFFCDAGAVTPLQGWNGTTDYDLIVIQPDDGWGQSRDDVRKVLEAMTASGLYDARPIGRIIVLERRQPSG
jgi:hypothetical protein